MKRQLIFILLACTIGSGLSPAKDAPAAWPVASQNVVWDSPGADARGSMPVGNGDIGANVWVEPNGDLVLLIGKSDSFDDFNRLLKLGRIRIKTMPALFQSGRTFTQTLRLEDGSIEIATDTAKLRVWVDANHPVVQVDGMSPSPIAAQVLLENWRKEPRVLSSAKTGSATMPETASAYGNQPDKRKVNADTILPAKSGQLAWCHHNVESQWRHNLELTALGDEIAKGKDPILNRSFGAVVRAAGFTATSANELKSAAPAKSFSVQIVALTTFADSPEAWLASAEKTADAVPASTPDRFTTHQKWWLDFWSRSWIDLSSGNGEAVPTASYPGKLCLGADTKGTNPFRGTIVLPTSIPRALTNDEIFHLANDVHDGPAAKETPDISLHGDFTVAAWIKPAADEHGRIFDKSTPATADGLLFDTEPGNSLRYNLGGSLIQHNHCLKPDVWQHVAATFNAKTGEQRLYLDGLLLDSRKLESDVDRVTRAYTLQRYVTACAGRGNLPVKFNGSLFTVEGPDPDYRSWGGAYWWQNTREAYWAMLYAGDYEMMEPLFKMYREALPLRMAATRKYYQHDGAFFPETMYFWGNYNDENYGFDRKGKPDGLTDNLYIRRYWQSGLELVAMLLDAHDGTRDAKLLDKTLLPIAKQITLFYDQHWQRGPDGKILFDPAQSLETWHTARNPLPEIAGLRFILPRLLELPADEAAKAHWRKLLADLPAVPVKTENGKTRIMPADAFSDKKNAENPELYGIFPYRIYTAMTGGAELEQGLNAWRVRRHPEDRGWQQNCIQAPLLGLAAEAKTMISARAASTAGGYRFPGFFGPNYDWTPEQCHGTNLMTGVQRMLMQCEGTRIVLLPAWPKDWNASFKLHAPGNTTVEARVENGELKDLKVTPESRRKDVEVRKAES